MLAPYQLFILSIKKYQNFSQNFLQSLKFLILT